VFIDFGEGRNACGDGVGLDHIYGGGAVGGVPMEFASDEFVQLGSVCACDGAAVGYNQAAAVFYVLDEGILDSGGAPRGGVGLGRLIHFGGDDHGIIGQSRGVKIRRVVDDIQGKSFLLEGLHALVGHVAGVVMVVAQ